MSKLLLKSLYLTFLTLCISSPSWPQNVTLSWDPSPTPTVTGYRVYYDQTPAAPLDSTDAVEGPSPIDAGNSLTTNLTLPDNAIYYFTVTAYDANGNESSFSNVVSNSWMPELLSPADQSIDEPIPALFRWTTENTDSLTYTLFYGKDKSSVANAGTAFSLPENPGLLPPATGVFIISILLFFAATRHPSRRKGTVFGASLLTCAVLSSCGGGGGGGDSSSPSRTSTPSTVAATVYSIEKGTSDYHQAYDLEAGTTYYWKVVGIDTANPTQEYSSTVASFTTTSL